MNRFIQLADDSDEVPELREKKYQDFRISRSEWTKLELMHEVLQVCIPASCSVLNTYEHVQEPANATQSFSSSHTPTVSRTIPVLEFLQTSWENMANNPKFSQVEDAIRAGLENLGKWYQKVDDTDVYFMCLGILLLSPSLYAADNLMSSIGPQLETGICRREMGPRVSQKRSCSAGGGGMSASISLYIHVGLRF